MKDDIRIKLSANDEFKSRIDLHYIPDSSSIRYEYVDGDKILTDYNIEYALSFIQYFLLRN